jgi:hypothetical protein
MMFAKLSSIRKRGQAKYPAGIPIHAVRLTLQELEPRVCMDVSLGLIVTTTADSGPGSLRQAIIDSNKYPFGSYIQIQVTGVINLLSALPDITDTPISGPGANLLTVERSPSATTPFRIFTVDKASAPYGGMAFDVISGLTISGGDTVEAPGVIGGGGILNEGDLTLEDCTISGNSVTASGAYPADGGGIANEGTLTLQRCRVSGNVAEGQPNAFSFPSIGGGIYNEGRLTAIDCSLEGNRATGNAVDQGQSDAPSGGGYGAALGQFGQVHPAVSYLFACTIDGNAAIGGFGAARGPALGGAVYINGGAVQVTNCTIAGNEATASNKANAAGGAIYVDHGSAAVAGTTIADNSAISAAFPSEGGGIAPAGNSVNLSNTIVANNSAANGPDIYGSVTSAGYNLIGNGRDAEFNGVAGHDLVGVDPRLGPLQDNGGSTETMALLPGSPGIDAGDPSTAGLPSIDQRGLPRVSNGRVDIGAVEAQPGESDVLHPTISAASPSVVFYVSPDHALWRYDASGWTQIGGAGTIREVSAVTDGFGLITVFAATVDHALFRFDALSGWQELGAPGTVWAASAGISASGRADAFVMLMDAGLTRWSTLGGWLAAPIGAPGTIATAKAGIGGRAYAVGTDHTAFGYDDQRGWFTLSSAGPTRTLDATGTFAGQAEIDVIGVNSDLKQIADNGSTVTGSATPLGAGIDSVGAGGAIFALTLDNNFMELNSAGWQRLGAAGTILDFAATSLDRVFAELSDGSLSVYDAQTGWTALPPLPTGT